VKFYITPSLSEFYKAVISRKAPAFRRSDRIHYWNYLTSNFKSV